MIAIERKVRDDVRKAMGLPSKAEELRQAAGAIRDLGMPKLAEELRQALADLRKSSGY
jgi:hypothetical protein